MSTLRRRNERSLCELGNAVCNILLVHHRYMGEPSTRQMENYVLFNYTSAIVAGNFKNSIKNEKCLSSHIGSESDKRITYRIAVLLFFILFSLCHNSYSIIIR